MTLDHPASLKQAAEAIRSGAISSEEMTRAALSRAKASQRRLNAFIEIDEDHALSSARQADAARATGRNTGLLHGLPLAHKDMFDEAGRITGCGSLIRAGHVAMGTSTVLARLGQAGSFSIGRLNMSEFAMGPTGHNHHHGRAINPIDPERITGGSSSGSGAAVGAGVVLAALGSDTGGSIRLPAACCGTVGIKPTQGRVSRHGAMPLSFSQDCIGPLATGVEDAWLILSLISGPDGHDPTCLDAPLRPLLDGVKGLRIGLAKGPLLQSLSDEVGEAVQSAARVLEGEGAELADAPFSHLEAVTELANAVAMTEAAAVHFDGMRKEPERFGPQVRMRLSQGLAIPGPLYVRALQIRSVMLARFLEQSFAASDVLILPAMPFVAPLDRDVDVGAGSRMNEVISAMTSLTRPFSYLGLPVVTLPVASSRERLPIALQVVARPWREDLAVSVARHLERVLALSPFTLKAAA
ncbi:amidase [Rhizobium paknamense]|uniref:Indoleacetamide hydrolase n=1 Tax=Rhizobium paknamense TaxID=1206817 RepID=A0ABU0IEV3_9HYPH|nr:amidase [Rhizobium paknamense]MDQ0456762.1 aspartyl-tRNA(Asn)/glutamyl-tRNA(Gln) amidotransferase subunit A [Rhizobium paknamense]